MHQGRYCNDVLRRYGLVHVHASRILMEVNARYNSSNDKNIHVGIPLSVDLIEHRGEPSRKPSRNWKAVSQAGNMEKIGEGRRRNLFTYDIR